MKKCFSTIHPLFVTALLLCLGVAACKDSSEDLIVGPASYKGNRVHAVQYYAVIDRCIMKTGSYFTLPLGSSGSYETVVVYSDTCKVNRQNPNIYIIFDDCGTFLYTNRSANFFETARKFGDTNPKEVAISKEIPSKALESGIYGVNVVAMDDFDSRHPAGSSLNDLIVLNYTSVDHVVKSGYDLDAAAGLNNGWMMTPGYIRENVGENYYFHVELSEIGKSPLQLVGEEFFLSFKSLPTEGNSIRMRVEYVFENDYRRSKELNTIWY